MVHIATPLSIYRSTIEYTQSTMPHVFRFHGQDRQWEAALYTRSCSDATCDAMVSIGSPYCATHLVSHYKLKIGPSYIQGAGLGLFCTDGDEVIDLSQPLIKKDTC